jgi:hypothetical protein
MVFMSPQRTVKGFLKMKLWGPEQMAVPASTHNSSLNIYLYIAELKERA